MNNLRIHVYYILSILALGGIAYHFISNNNVALAQARENTTPNTSVEYNPLKLTSQKGYSFIQPLLKANQENESKDFTSLRARIMNVFNDNQKSGILTGASVYLFCLSDGRWMYINPNEHYHPGSLMKMPMLLTYLRDADLNPEMLNRKFSFNSADKVPAQTFSSTNTLKNGQTYTVRELLRYMAAYSDNGATRILNENANIPNFIKTFTDLNMPEPNVTDRNYSTSAKDISEFFLVLYYGTYISKKYSEYAMQLLSECDFKEGMVKELPADVKVAHKFGEWGDNRVNQHEMHEAGIVYVKNKPYLITIVTKGTNSKDLANVVSKVSKIVYDDFTSTSVAQSL